MEKDESLPSFVGFPEIVMKFPDSGARCVDSNMSSFLNGDVNVDCHAERASVSGWKSS